MLTFNRPKDNLKYEWTNHIVGKMLFYRISEGRVKRIIKSPQRTEEGIAPGTIAVMQKASSKRPSEYWAMYQQLKSGRKRVITTWRYPGISPKRAVLPIPDDIVLELKKEGLIK